MPYKSEIKQMVQLAKQSLAQALPREIDAGWLERVAGRPHWRYQPQAVTQALAMPVWDLLSREGKYWRPVLALLTMEALGQRPRPYAPVITAIAELCHSGAIIIDDIEDDSRTRRGKPCLHRRYGLDVAINAANTLYFLPFQLVQTHPQLDHKQKAEIQAVMVRIFTRAHLGQAVDIYWTRRRTAAALRRRPAPELEAQVLQMYADKTAAPVEGIMEIVCIMARAKSSRRAAVVQAAHSFGVAFQIIDDVLNYTQVDKNRGNMPEDFVAGKLTYVLIAAGQALAPGDRCRLGEIFSTPQLRQNRHSLKQARELLQKCGAFDVCRRKAAALFARDWQSFVKAFGTCRQTAVIEQLCRELLERQG